MTSLLSSPVLQMSVVITFDQAGCLESRCLLLDHRQAGVGPLRSLQFLACGTETCSKHDGVTGFLQFLPR